MNKKTEDERKRREKKTIYKERLTHLHCHRVHRCNCLEGRRAEAYDSRSLSILGKLNPGKIQFGMNRIESCKIIAREREREREKEREMGGWRCHLFQRNYKLSECSCYICHLFVISMPFPFSPFKAAATLVSPLSFPDCPFEKAAIFCYFPAFSRLSV